MGWCQCKKGFNDDVVETPVDAAALEDATMDEERNATNYEGNAENTTE